MDTRSVRKIYRVTGGIGPRRKGASYERDVVNWLRGNGYPNAERRIMGMSDDRGDITGVPGVVIECKNQQRIELGSWFTQMQLEQIECQQYEPRHVFGVLFIKRRGTVDVGQHYVVMSGYDWADLATAYRPA